MFFSTWTRQDSLEPPPPPLSWLRKQSMRDNVFSRNIYLCKIKIVIFFFNLDEAIPPSPILMSSSWKKHSEIVIWSLKESPYKKQYFPGGGPRDLCPHPSLFFPLLLRPFHVNFQVPFSDFFVFMGLNGGHKAILVPNPGHNFRYGSQNPKVCLMSYYRWLNGVHGS